MDLEITPEELRTLREQSRSPVLLDVREPWEFTVVSLPGSMAMPMGEVPARAYNELDPDAHIVVVCHHGVRSLHVAHWLRKEGFDGAQSLRGGIDAWAATVEPGLARY